MNDMPVTIRPEEADDHERVHAVIAAAFGGEAEATLIRRLRGNAAPEISLVALDPGRRIVGHIYFSPVKVGTSRRPAIALGPVSVDPACQHRAIGSALCRRGLEECSALGESVVFVLGHATYYPRFGFELARPHGLYHAPTVSIIRTRPSRQSSSVPSSHRKRSQDSQAKYATCPSSTRCDVLNHVTGKQRARS